jgi:hypothetical protein
MSYEPAAFFKGFWKSTGNVNENLADVLDDHDYDRFGFSI